MALVTGLLASVRIVVADTDTATAMGSGDVPVLATPRLLALAEAASVAAVTPSLERGTTSVGTSVAMEHKRASPIGAEVVVEAELTGVYGPGGLHARGSPRSKGCRIGGSGYGSAARGGDPRDPPAPRDAAFAPAVAALPGGRPPGIPPQQGMPHSRQRLWISNRPLVRIRFLLGSRGRRSADRQPR